LWAAVRKLARILWVTPGQGLMLGSSPSELLPGVEDARRRLAAEEARLLLGSRSLLKRDAEGTFSFIHRSVLEWLVADEAARELAKGGKAEVRDAERISPLSAAFC